MAELEPGPTARLAYPYPPYPCPHLDVVELVLLA